MPVTVKSIPSGSLTNLETNYGNKIEHILMVPCRVVAVNPRGYFLHYDGKDDENKYRRYLPTYRAGASIHSDALIPYPMLIRAKQEFQSSDLDIAYRVTDPDDSKVTTGMLAFIDGEKRFEKLIVPKSFIGPVVGKLGPNVDVNVTHSVSWDMAQDWNASEGT